MQALQRTLQTIGGQLKMLSPTAKMLLGSLMIILVMSLFLVSLYAGGRDMIPLGLAASVSAEARARAVDYLKSTRIPHEVSGSEVLVPADQKLSILASLTESQIIGADQINFDRLLNDDNLFRTNQQSRQRYLVAKMNMLSAMISQMSGIERATVVLDPSESNAIGKSHVPSSASVTVMGRGGELNQAQVDAIARLVAGAHAGLKPQNVAIIDARTGRYHQARTDDTLNAGKYMEVKQDFERHAKATIETALGFIPGVRVAVNAQVDTKQVVQQTTKHDEPTIGVTQETSESMTSSAVSGAGEPGVRSNTGVSLAPTNRPGTQVAQEKTQTSSIPYVGTDSKRINDTKGYAVQINATIGVPKSYFVHVFQDQQGGSDKQPDQNELDALVQKETERIKSYVAPLIDTQAMEGAVAGTIAVSMIPEFKMVANLDSATMDVAGSSLVNDGLVKYIGLGGLAVLSLTMMFLMVRKAGARPELPSASELVGIPPALAAAESDLVGEADEASPALEGLELNDDAIRRQQMLEQITDMVTSTPEDAANLLRRWMKSEA